MCASSSTANNCFNPSWNCLRCFSSRLRQQSRLGARPVWTLACTCLLSAAVLRRPNPGTAIFIPLTAALVEALQLEWQQNFHEAAWIPGARAARTG
jgi:hypothetical protein